MTSTDGATDVAKAAPAAQSGRGTITSFAALTVTVLLVAATLGAYPWSGLQGSSRLVLVASVIALLSPLFWPGRAATPRATGWRILGWSLAAATLAVIATSGAGKLLHVATAAVMLLLICIATLGAAAYLESFFVRRSAATATASDASAWLATALLAIPAAAPLWLGPTAELASAERPYALQAVVAVSPLTHVAVASGNDLLRNQWFYQHSNLAGLRFDYPRLAPVIATYAALGFALVLIPAVARPRRQPGSKSTSSQE
jgi:hypothetical protein